MTEHSVEGVGTGTRVYCGKTDSEYGPYTQAKSEFDFCPYCGADTDTETHDVQVSLDEVFCENTSMSTWRYCPNCGERADK